MTTLTPTVEKTGTGLRRVYHLTRWNLSRALIVTRREVVDMFRDWRIIFPIVILTLLFPYVANAGANRLVRFVAEYNDTIIAERLIPLLLLVVGFFPASFSLIIALESFVGEKERHSLEPLLSSPLTNTQLYLGKMLSTTIPPVAGSLLGITVYLTSLYFSLHWKPPLILLVLTLSLTIAHAVVMVAGAVVISSQTTSVRAANLLASFIIVPMSFLIPTEAFVMFFADYDVLWLFLIGLIALATLLIRMGIQVFNREELLGNEIDDLNMLRTIQTVIIRAIARQPEVRRSAWTWYQEEVLTPMRGLWKEIVLIIITMIAAYFIGVSYIERYPIPLESFYTDDFQERFQAILRVTGFDGIEGVLKVLGQNVRVLAVASFMAVISFGILAAIILMLPIGLIGYLAPQMIMAGIPPMVAWAAVIPHSIFEVPAIILAGAVAMKVGTSVIAPPAGKTVGEAWLESISLAIRLWWTAILPLLMVAAAIEIFITPAVVGMVVGG